MSSVYTIKDHEQISTHIETLYKAQHPLRVTSEEGLVEGAPLIVHRMIYDVSRPQDLLLKVQGSSAASAPNPGIEINYTLDAMPHRFRAEVIGRRAMGPEGAILKLRLPERIGVLNRRAHLRLQPLETMPITVALYPPGGGTLSCPVVDISSGGLGFAVPAGSLPLRPDTQLPLRIYLHEGHMVPATIIIRHLIPDNGMMRVGAEFQSISSEGRQMISDYIITATLGQDRLSAVSAGQLPLVCVIGEAVEEADLAQLESFYRLIRHNLTADWRHLLQIEPDALLFHNLGDIPAERLVPKVMALPSFNKTPSVLITDEPDLDTDLDLIMVSSVTDTASVIEAMETAITERRVRQKETAPAQTRSPTTPETSTLRETSTLSETSITTEAAPSGEGEAVLVLNLQRRISMKTVCCMKSYNHRLMVVNRQDQVLRFLTEQRPAFMVLAAASVKELKPLLDELSADTSLVDIPRVVLVDPPQRVDIKHLSQPIRLSNTTYLFFKTGPDADLIDQIFATFASQ